MLAQVQFWSLFIGVNTTFMPQHFLGLAGMLLFIKFYPNLFNLDLNNNSELMFMSIRSVMAKPLGPHINPKNIWVNKPVRVYDRTNRRDLIKNYRGVPIIYQWINLITGETYVGSRINGRERLSHYYTPSHLRRNRRIYNSIKKYGHSNFAVGILEIIKTSDKSPVDRKYVLSREQFYLDILLNSPLYVRLNLAPTAGNTSGFKHTEEFKDSRKGKGNPMYGHEYSPEFKEQQIRDKSGSNNPQYSPPCTVQPTARAGWRSPARRARGN